MKISFINRRILAAIGLLFVAHASNSFALVDATWNATPASGLWNTGANWSGAVAPTGVATFGTSSVTSISLSTPVSITSMVFNSGASAYTITSSLAYNLTISGVGITNNSGRIQNLVLNGNTVALTPTTIAFTNSATAGTGTRFTLNDGTGSGSMVSFSDTATAGSATFISYGSTPSTLGGGVKFFGSSTAGTANFTSYGTTSGGEGAGYVLFDNTANAGSATFTNLGGPIATVHGGITMFLTSANAGSATITNNAGVVNGSFGGYTGFENSANAGSATITNLGGTVSGSAGGQTYFDNTANAGSSTLIATGGTNGGGGGEIDFYATSDGGTARVIANGNGFLDISTHTGAMGIGSIEGSGNFILGANALTVGGNNLSTSVTGVISGVGGSLTKAGTGTMVLSGANTYTGATTVSGGTLQFAKRVSLYNATPASWTAAKIIVNSGATLALNLDSAGTNGFTSSDLDTIKALGGAATGFKSGSVLGLDTSTATGGTFTYATAITNTNGGANVINLTKLGAGTLVLSGTNTYTGVTTVQAGTLQFANTAALYNSTPANWTNTNIIVNAGATFAVNVDSAGTHGFTSGNLDSLGAGGLGGFAVNSTLAFDTSTATGGTFTYATGMGNSSNGLLNFTKLGAGTLILSGTNTYTGTTTVLGGSLSILGNMNVTSGLNLSTGSSLTVGGTITLNSGAIAQVNGTLTSQQLDVLGTGILKGSGTYNGNVVSSGTVAPGNSPGTLSIVGDFTQTRAGTFSMEIASLSNFDRLIVSGKANLGGTLHVQNYGGNVLSFGQQYSFIQAGSIVGSFDNIIMPDPSKFRGRFLVDGGTGTLLVAPESYALVAKTTNQRNVAKALDHFITAVGNDREVVSTALDKQSETQYPAAFNAISPAFHETIANITIEQAFDQTQMLNQRLSSVRLGAQGFQLIGMNAEPLAYDKNGKKSADPKDLKTVIQQDNNPNWSAWAMGSGIFGKTTDVSQISNYHSETGSCLIGADYRWSEHFSTGLYGGYQGTYVDYANKSNNRMNSALFGGYATYTAGGFYTDAVVGGGYNAYNVRRTIDFSTIKRTAHSDQQSGQLNAALNFGYDWKVAGFTLGPVLGAQYTYVGIAPFTETGASSLDLAVKQQNANSLRTTLGGRIAYTWNVTSKIVLIPEIRMLWEQEFMNGSRAIGSSLAGGSGPSFSTWTDAPQRSSAFAGAGVSTQIGSTWNASVFYNVDFGRQSYLANMVSASLGLKF